MESTLRCEWIDRSFVSGDYRVLLDVDICRRVGDDRRIIGVSYVDSERSISGTTDGVTRTVFHGRDLGRLVVQSSFQVDIAGCHAKNIAIMVIGCFR